MNSLKWTPIMSVCFTLGLTREMNNRIFVWTLKKSNKTINLFDYYLSKIGAKGKFSSNVIPKSLKVEILSRHRITFKKNRHCWETEGFCIYLYRKTICCLRSISRDWKAWLGSRIGLPVGFDSSQQIGFFWVATNLNYCSCQLQKFKYVRIFQSSNYLRKDNHEWGIK